ncbi:MAG: energy-coupling factor transporter ATPase [Firmicutes bacterium]|nr:energy-coupling factor transporter ATPase [Bacillota bacterium]
MQDNIITLENVSFEYTDDDDHASHPVFSGLDLSIARGSFTCVLGHNGCGKSTMAKLLNGLNKPASGKVTVDGMDTADESRESAIRRRVGMVFQNPDNQMVATIVEEDVAFGPENIGIAPQEIRKRVDSALRAVGMYEYRTHATHKLSGGQKQRVAIAGVLAMHPECIVLDEPTAMLDPQGRAEVISTVKQLNRERGITIVLITHYMDEAVEADRIVVMDSGRIIMDGAPRDVFSRVDKLRSVGLDVPQSAELAYRLSQNGVDIPGDVLTPEECARAIARVIKSEV